MEQLSLSITGMHCGACVRRVTTALEKIPGVRVGTVEVGSARVQYDRSQADAAVITSAIEKLGFSASAQNS